MSAAPPATVRAVSPGAVVVLQYANPTRMITVPLCIVAAVVVVIAGITFAVDRNGGSTAGLDGNGSVIWSLFGFLVAVGVQAVAVAFPLALALGATRRAFTLGVLAASLIESALLAAGALALLGLELATGGWFVGARVLRDSTLGGGDPLALAAAVMLLTLTCLAAGGLFGAAWVRFGGRGPLLLGGGLAAAAVLGLLLAPDLAAVARSFEAWWLTAGGAAVIVASTAGQLVLLRRAAVR